MSCRICLIDPNSESIVKSLKVDRPYIDAEAYVKNLNNKLKEKPNKKELFWKITEIGI